MSTLEQLVRLTGLTFIAIACACGPESSGPMVADVGGVDGSTSDVGAEAIDTATMTRTDLSVGRDATETAVDLSSLAEVGGRDVSGDLPGRDLGPGIDGFECTHVIGYSQVRQWYSAGGTPSAFESEVGDERWQLRWNSGGAVNLWADPSYSGWNESVVSECATMSGDAEVDRVLLSVSGGFGSDVDAWVGATRDAVATIRSVHTNARQIVLQPVVGGPNHAECQFEGRRVRASFQHPFIDEALEQVSQDADDIVVGASPEVESCDDYRDRTGHLRDAAEPRVGAALGLFYATF